MCLGSIVQYECGSYPHETMVQVAPKLRKIGP